jgi:hypothetical protein
MVWILLLDATSIQDQGIVVVVHHTNMTRRQRSAVTFRLVPFLAAKGKWSMMKSLDGGSFPHHQQVMMSQ